MFERTLLSCRILGSDCLVSPRRTLTPKKALLFTVVEKPFLDPSISSPSVLIRHVSGVVTSIFDVSFAAFVVECGGKSRLQRRRSEFVHVLPEDCFDLGA